MHAKQHPDDLLQFSYNCFCVNVLLFRCYLFDFASFMVIIKRNSQFSNPEITVFSVYSCSVNVTHTTYMKDDIFEKENFVSVLPLYSYLISKCCPQPMRSSFKSTLDGQQPTVQTSQIGASRVNHSSKRGFYEHLLNHKMTNETLRFSGLAHKSKGHMTSRSY